MHATIFETAMVAAFVAFVLGVVAVLADTKYGEKVWRFGHWLTHLNPLPENAEVGFVVGHEGFEARSTQGFWLSVFETFVAYWFLHKSFFACFLILLVGIPFAALGIAATPLVVKIFKQKGAFFKKVQETADKVSETAEKVRSGEISLKPDLEAAGDVVKVAVAVAAAKVANVATSAKDSVMEHLPDFAKATSDKPEFNNTVPVETVIEDKPVPPQMSAEEEERLRLEAAKAAIEKFVGKKESE